MHEFFRGWKLKHGVLALQMVVACVLIIVAWASYVIINVRAVAKESPQRALLSESHKLLSDYFSIHGHFPKSFDELPFTYPDGGNNALLDEFVYTVQGPECRIVVKCASTGTLIIDNITPPTPKAPSDTP